MEIRFSFHPVKKVFLVSSDFEAHSETIFKHGKKLPFDGWIRGIIKEKVLFLRLYYPYDDIDQKSLEEIEETSFNLLFDNKKAIIKALKSQGFKIPSKIGYNATNEGLKGQLINI